MTTVEKALEGIVAVIDSGVNWGVLDILATHGFQSQKQYDHYADHPEVFDTPAKIIDFGGRVTGVQTAIAIRADTAVVRQLAIDLRSVTP